MIKSPLKFTVYGLNMQSSLKSKLFSALIVASVFTGCTNHDIEVEPIVVTPPQPYEITSAWADVTLNTLRTTKPNTPTYASRSLGYIGLTMYEAVVQGSAMNKSLAGQVNGLDALPLPESGKTYDWELVLNASQATILKSLYGHMTAQTEYKIDSLETALYEIKLSIIKDQAVVDRSVQYGKDIANAIYEWSKTDGGHEGYLHNFDPTYTFPSGPGYWVAPSDGQSPSVLPLHPHWGENRTFIVANATLPMPEILAYSTDPESDYYKQFKEVHDKRISLTKEEMEIAAWWGDDPTFTSSPPGHSYNLVTIAVGSTKSDLITGAEAYAKVGMAVCDAFINCWKCKYTYHAERPTPYIKAFIDADYQRFWPEPPFPAFSSGHSTQSAAAAIALTSVFGENFELTDDTYVGRAKDTSWNIEYKARHFNSIWDTAEECAYSRFLGGIHTRQDNEKGTEEGIVIGKNINALSWKK